MLAVIGKVILIALGLILVGAGEKERTLSREAEKRPTKHPEQLTRLQRIRQSRPYRAFVLIGQFVLVGLTVAAFVGTFWGPFWPIAPKLHPAGDDFSLPFTVNNTSNFFSLRLLELGCNLGGTDPKDPKKQASYNVFRMKLNVPVVEAGGVANLSCERTYLPGFDAKRAEMWVGVAYQIEWHGHAVQSPTYVANIFQFEHGKWVEGPIY